MPAYANRGGDSGVVSYDIADESITVTFRDGASYLYNYSAPGRSDVEHMKTLANAGEGLNSFIGIHVKNNYASKLR